MKSIAVLITLILALSAVTMAQGFGNQCTPAGTWYGGDEHNTAKYLMVVTPSRAGIFNMRFVQGFTPKVSRISEFSGEILKTEAGGWESYSIALLNNDLISPPAGAAPDIRAAHTVMQFEGCNKLISKIDFYALYKWDQVPFLDSDYTSVFKPGQTEIEETYYRMPTTCPFCPQY